MYDVVIIGGGPAGMSAAIYAIRSGLSSVLVEGKLYGGQMQNTLEVENYPGYATVLGPELSDKMREHAETLGLNSVIGNVSKIDVEGSHYVIRIDNYSDLATKSVIIATGSQPRKLGVPGEAEFSGRGVSYCAVCDGMFFRGKHVYVVGGGDSAVEEGIYLTKHAAKVTIVHRRDQLRAQPILVERAMKNDKLEVIYNTEVVEVKGNRKVEELVLKNNVDGTETTVLADGVFIYVGMKPNTDFLASEAGLEIQFMDDAGFIMTNEKMETCIPGIFAAGDVRATHLRQIITAAADGAVAAISAYKYVENFDA